MCQLAVASIALIDFLGNIEGLILLKWVNHSFCRSEQGFFCEFNSKVEYFDSDKYLSFRAGLLLERMLPLKLVLLSVGPVQEDPLPVPLLPPEVPEEMGVLENDLLEIV